VTGSVVGSARGMVSVEAARSRARAVYERSFASWATLLPVGPVLDLPLHPPTEAAALTNGAAAIGWVTSWRDAGADEVAWTHRQWASLGAQSVPERLRFDSPTSLAAFAGKTTHWRTVSTRCAALIERWDGHPAVAAVLRRHARAIGELPPADFARLTAVIDWLVAHPNSGLYIRQLPIGGVDTKWVGAHRSLVTSVVTAITGATGLGLEQPPGLVRVRFLDPALRPGGLDDVAAPVETLAALDLHPTVVYVFENLESVVAMPEVTGAVVVHGSGYAVDRLGRIPWIRDGRIVYWGDLDSNGFAILNRLRSHCSNVQTVLMDEDVLIEHSDLWVPEPTPATGEFSHLLPEERAVVARLRELGDVRLEQERLTWPLCVERLQRAAADNRSVPQRHGSSNALVVPVAESTARLEGSITRV
jgi:hypothetical protein